MAGKVLKVDCDQPMYFYNIERDTDNFPCPACECVRDPGGCKAQVRNWGSSVKNGNAWYHVDDISSRITQFQNVTVIGIFSTEGVGDPDNWEVQLHIDVHGTAGDPVIGTSAGTYFKSYDKSPDTGEDFTNDEIRDLLIKFSIEVPGCVYPAPPPYNLGKLDYFRVEVTFDAVVPEVQTDPATDITNSSALLNGEITDDGGECTERGFEYYKDGDPGNVVTVKETGTFGDGVYGLTAGGLEAGTKYYFRAYALNEADTGYGSWESFVTTAVIPTVTTQGASVPVPIINTNYEYAEGNGTIVATGGQVGVYKCKERGFEVKLEFSGSLYGFIEHHIAGFTGQAYFNFDNFKYEGTLIKTEKESGSFGEGPFSLMLGSWGVYMDKLFAGESYTYRAFATNDEGTGYGEWVAFSLGPLELIVIKTEPPDDDIIEGETTEIKWVTLLNLVEGQFATRIGIRYGTTPSANEFDIHIDGLFWIGSYQFVLTDLIPNTKYYQVPYFLIEDGLMREGAVTESQTLPKDEGPWPPGGGPGGPGGIGGPRGEFVTPHYSPRGQDYREIVTKVLAERLSAQPIIDFSGGKKTLKLVNHLMQEQDNALVVADNYLSRFQYAKTKMVVEYATPMPFEREDTIDFDYGRILFKADGEGVISFRADGQGCIKFLHMVSVMVRKIGLKMGVTEKTVEYLATLELEKE